MAAGDATSITISADDTDTEVGTKITAMSIVSGDIVFSINHGGQSRIVKVKTA